jgi:hypothetical protein
MKENEEEGKEMMFFSLKKRNFDLEDIDDEPEVVDDMVLESMSSDGDDITKEFEKTDVLNRKERMILVPVKGTKT